MAGSQLKSPILFCILKLLVGFLFLAGPIVGHAQIVINEIHYNPPDSFDAQDLDVEFIELHNPTVVPIDLSGASFSGIDYTFPEGSLIEAVGYIVLAPEIADAQQVWGITPYGSFGGGLSGKGETIQLLAPDGVTVLDALTYDDSSPWPGTPDGSGPSLELINPALDNSVAESWAASLQAIPTPGSQNSVFAPIGSPTLSKVEIVPAVPEPNIAFFIQVDAPNADNPHYYYRLNLNSEIGPLPLSNLEGDTWHGLIPAQSGGSLVRFRFVNGATQSPAVDDTINYHGVVVVDPDLATTQLPTFQFYINDEDFSGLYDTPYDDDEFPVVVAFENQVVDNARIRIRGGSSRKWLKKNFKIELPDGYSFNLGDHSPYPLDEFAWQADRGDVPFNATLFAWDALAEEGEPDIANFHMRLEKNGDFFGLYRLQEVYDASYRREHNRDEGQLYKAVSGGFLKPESAAAFDKKHPDDGDDSPIVEAMNAVNNLNGDELRSWVYDNIDIPSVINYSALTSLLRHGDQETKNYYAFQDGETERWSMLFWDLDQTWLYGSAGPCPPDDMTIPTCLGNPFLNAVLDLPEFEAMHWRRTQSLVDKWLFLYDLETRREEVIGRISVDEADFDLQLWGAEGTHWDSNLRLDPYYKDRWELKSLQRRRATFNDETRLPPAAGGNVLPIVINEIHYKPADPNEAEFIELYNPNNVAIDLSGWKIEDGINLDIRFGTVISAKGYVVFTDEDVIFRAENPGDIFVAGQYSGGLKSDGERVVLLDDGGSVVDEVEYNSSAFWPSEPDGGGPTLALISQDLDNSVASSWTSSAQFGGTPGQANILESTLPVISMSTESFIESDVDTTINLTFSLDLQATTSTSYSYSTVDGSAVSGIDYQSSTGVLQFSPGSTEVTIQLLINGDSIYTGDRMFTFLVEESAEGLIGEIGDVVILDDEYPPDETAPEWLDGSINVVSLSHESLYLEWSGATDNVAVEGYIVYVTYPDQTTQPFSTVSTSITLNGLTPSSSYRIRVEALDAVLNESVNGPLLQATTAAPPDISAPVWANPTLTIGNIESDSVVLDWQGASDAIGVVAYELSVEQIGAESYMQTETGTSKTLLGLRASTEYRFEVQALDAAGNRSTDGPVVFAKTKELPPGLIVTLDGVAQSVPLMPASSQDKGPGEVRLLSSGTQVELEGNLWKRVEINYEVKPDTILEFDFFGGSEGEVHAIGLETNSVVSSSLTFQLWGTQRFGKNTFNNYDQRAGQTVRYQIPIGALVKNRAYAYLTLISDQDRGPHTNTSRFSNIALLSEFDIEEDNLVPSWPNGVLSLEDISSSTAQINWSGAEDDIGISVYEIYVDDYLVGTSPQNSYIATNLNANSNYRIRVEALDLAGNRSSDGPQLDIQTAEAPPGFKVTVDGVEQTYELSGFGNQDRNGSYTLEQGGDAVRLDGNTWKYIQTELLVTPDMVISFDFESTSEGGVHGIAIENNLLPSSSKTFKLYGYKRYGRRDFDNYNDGDGSVRISIPIGQYLSGSHQYLVFVSDHDVGSPDAQSVFSNIVIESAAGSP
jgi:hypothetical protein